MHCELVSGYYYLVLSGQFFQPFEISRIMENLSRQIDRLLLEGLDKKMIWQRLRHKEDMPRLAFYLNNASLPADRAVYRYVNYFLALALLVMTAKKTLTAMAFGRLDLYFFMSLVVPTINLYVLFEIWRCRRRGYQFLFVLSCLALVRPENHGGQELVLLAVQIGLSGFLYLKMFAGRQKIIPADGEK